MTRAAGATRYGAVTVAEREAMTSAGICHVGDVLGLVGGDIIEIGSQVGEVAVRVVEHLCTGASELVTVVSGSESDESALAAVRAHLRSAHPGIELVEYLGGQPFWPLIVGVE
jgi:hypothetical protein